MSNSQVAAGTQIPVGKVSYLSTFQFDPLRVEFLSMANPPQRPALYGTDYGHLRSREGVGNKSMGQGSGEIQLRIDPMHTDVDEAITGLHQKIGKLKRVALDIETEAKFQNEFLAKLQMTVIKAKAGLKNNMKRMNKHIIQQGSNHVIHVILFALFCFFVVYFWSKFSR